MSYWTAMLGAQTRFITADGIRTRILEAGDDAATTTVLVHGSGGHAENFVTNVVPFSKAGHVVAPDLLGHGWNERPPGLEYRFDDVIAHLEAVIVELDDRPVNLVGLSLGGLIGARIAARSPQLVSRLCMICPPALHPNGAGSFSRNNDAARRLFENPSPELVRERFARMLHQPDVLTDEMVETRVAMCRLPGAAQSILAVLADFAEHWERYQIDAGVLEAIACPTLIVWGRYNPVGVEVAEAAAEKLDDGEVAVFENSGHWPHLEDQQAFEAKVTAFLTA